MISEHSQENKIDEKSESNDNTDVGKNTKVSDSLDKLFQEKRTARQSKKILMIGQKRMTSDVDSSESRERDLVRPTNKNPLLLKSKENNERQSARKTKGNNMNKELDRKYTGKLDRGKVS